MDSVMKSYTRKNKLPTTLWFSLIFLIMSAFGENHDKSPSNFRIKKEY